MSVAIVPPGLVPSKLAGVTGAFELKTIVYVRWPAVRAGSRLIIGRLLLTSIAILMGSTGVGVGLAVGDGLTEGLGLGLGVGDGLPGGFSTLLVSVSWKIRRCA